MKIYLPFNFQVRIYASREAKRIGICSQHNSVLNKHSLMWDFDSGELGKIECSLQLLQFKYKLPTIYVVESSLNNYHAYCFSGRTFLETIHILSDTPFIDVNFIRLGIIRGYFTLRISPRKDESFTLKKTLVSQYPNEVDYNDLTTNEYFTQNKGGK